MFINPYGKHTKGGTFVQISQTVVDTVALSSVSLPVGGGDILYGISFYWLNALSSNKVLEMRINGLAVPAGCFSAGTQFERTQSVRTNLNAPRLVVCNIQAAGAGTFAVGSCYIHADTTNQPYGYLFESEWMARDSVLVVGDRERLCSDQGIWPRNGITQVDSITIQSVDGSNCIGVGSDFRFFSA